VRVWLSILGVLSAACRPPDPTPAADDDPPFVPDPTRCDASSYRLYRECNTTIDATRPERDATDVYVRSDLVVDFAQEEGDAAACLGDADGNRIAATTSLSDDLRTLTLVPDAPLEPDAAHTLVVSYSCQGLAQIPFRTAATGVPVGEGWRDRAYGLDWAAFTHMEPRGLETLIRPTLEALAESPVVGFVGDEDTPQVFLGAAREGVQDTCRSTPVVDATWEDPWWSVTHHALGSSAFWVFGPTDAVVSVTIDGVLTPDAEGLEGVRVDLLVDNEAVEPSLDLQGQTVCEVYWGLGLACEPCGDGRDACTRVVLHGVPGQPVAAVPRSIEDVAADPGCASP
jgi:hypothetical protein